VAATQPAGPKCTCAEVNSFLQAYAASYTDGCTKATQNCGDSLSTWSCSYDSSRNPQYVWICKEASSTTTASSTTAEQIVTTTFTLSGDVSDYDTAKQDAMKSVFASAAGVDASKVTLLIAPASVAVTVAIAVADAAAASSTQSTLSSGILASASSLQGALASGGVAGVTVQSAPVIVSASGADLGSATAAQKAGGSSSGGGGSMGIAIGGAVGAVVVVGAIGAGVYYLKKKKQQPSLQTTTITTHDVAGVSMSANVPDHKI